MSMKRFGKHPKKSDYRTLRFAKYATNLKAPPSTADVDEAQELTDAQWQMLLLRYGHLRRDRHCHY